MVAYCLIVSLIYNLAGLVMLLMARFVARRLWLTISLWIIIGTGSMVYVVGMSPIIAIPIALVSSAMFIFVLFRFGILAVTAAMFTSHLIADCLLTVDPGRWYFRSSALVLVILAALAVHGFRAALAGRPAFGRAMLED
jgi:hypothetical protein